MKIQTTARSDQPSDALANHAQGLDQGRVVDAPRVDRADAQVDRNRRGRHSPTVEARLCDDSLLGEQACHGVLASQPYGTGSLDGHRAFEVAPLSTRTPWRRDGGAARVSGYVPTRPSAGVRYPLKDCFRFARPDGKERCRKRASETTREDAGAVQGVRFSAQESPSLGIIRRRATREHAERRRQRTPRSPGLFPGLRNSWLLVVKENDVSRPGGGHVRNLQMADSAAAAK